jgi:hypothetical protein
MTPSLIHMNNGGVVRNLMGAGTNDSHSQRIWGTLGAYTIGHDGVKLRLGASGQSPMLNVNPKWEGLGELAAQTGHGGGDFWTLYYFAREILFGEKGPFDIYGGCDVTIPGIQALRSSLEGGKPMEVPDFRKKADRDRYRNDDWQQERYDTKRGVFGGAVPKPTEKAANFTGIMKDIVIYAPMYRAYADWKKVEPSLTRQDEFLPVAQRLFDNYERLAVTYRDAREIVNAYPKSDGAQVLLEMLEVGEEKKALAPTFLPALKKEVAALKKKFGEGWIPLQKFEGSTLLPDKTRITVVGYPAKSVKFSPVEYNGTYGFSDVRSRYTDKKKQDGLVYARGFFAAKKAGEGKLRIGADGPFKVFVNRKEIGGNPNATNPISGHLMPLPVTWKKGKNEIVLAMRTNDGKAWGFMASALGK